MSNSSKHSVRELFILQKCSIISVPSYIILTTTDDNNNYIVILHILSFVSQKLLKENPSANIPQSLDSSSEVLAALSPEERELLKAITSKGYPLQTAIIALQKAGHQTSDQVFLVVSAEAVECSSR